MEDKLIDVLGDAVQKFDLNRLIRCGVVIVLAVLTIIGLNIAFKKFKERSTMTDDLKRLHTFTTIHRLVKILVGLSAIMAVLQINGVNITGFILLIVIAAAAAAFAVQDAFHDIFSGLIIMLDKYYKVGDAVEFEGRDGVVVAFSIRTTKIELLEDRSVVSVMNRNISKIRTLTHLVDIDLPLPYEAARPRVFETLTAICDRIRALEGVEDCQLKGTQEFAASAVIYKIRFFCEPYDRPDIRRQVLQVIQDGLAAADLHVPYSQIDVHTKSK